MITCGQLYNFEVQMLNQHFLKFNLLNLEEPLNQKKPSGIRVVKFLFCRDKG